MNGDALKRLACTFGGLGNSPVAPGTVGTLGGVAIAWLFAGSSGFFFWMLLAAAGLYLVGRGLGAWAEKQASGKDPQWFVLDEVIGYLIAIAWTVGPTWLTLLAAFVLFRFFDIVKPWPAKRLERLRGGDGILLDDVIAGIYAWIVLLLLRLFVLTPAHWEI